MAKTSTRSKSTASYKCSECGWTTVKWVGRCGECQAWGTVEEVGVVSARTAPAAKVAHPAKPIAQIDGSEAAFRPSGVSELDRVLGGGLVPAAAILLAGEPGVGKSTLLLDVAAKAAHTGLKVLYLTGEESAAQVKSRAERINAVADNLYLAAETDLSLALGQIQEINPQLLILDSVQTFSSAEVDGAAGSVSQVREVAASIINSAKTRGMTTIMVGHVTKEGSVAGPRLLEHLVDVVCQFDGEKHSRLRILRALKNRYGATDEVGCFDLNEDGIESLTDPSKLFVTRTRNPVPGTCITVTLEGRRPLVAAGAARHDRRRATSAPGASGRRHGAGPALRLPGHGRGSIHDRAQRGRGRPDTGRAAVPGVRAARGRAARVEPADSRCHARSGRRARCRPRRRSVRRRPGGAARPCLRAGAARAATAGDVADARRVARAAGRVVHQGDGGFVEAAVDLWFGEEAQARLRALFLKP